MLSDRIKEVRTSLGLSQEVFGQKLGVKKSAVSKMENGTYSPTEQMLKLIASEYRINFFWLKEGVGEMFSNLPETLFDEMAEEYKLDELDKIIVKSYMNLPAEKREIFKMYIKNVFEEFMSK